MLAMQLNLRIGPGSDEAAARATVLDCARRVTPRRDLVHACCLVDEAESICAPFYVWRTTGAMCRFLLGGPFEGVVRCLWAPARAHQERARIRLSRRLRHASIRQA